MWEVGVERKPIGRMNTAAGARLRGAVSNPFVKNSQHSGDLIHARIEPNTVRLWQDAKVSGQQDVIVELTRGSERHR